MIQRRLILVSGVTTLLFMWSLQPAFSQTIEERLQKVEQEIENNKAAAEGGSSFGDKLSFHGYGELHYNSPETGSKVPTGSAPAQMDFHRMVWGLSYQFNEWISLHTEVDFEHGAKEVELEFAYLDFLINPAFNLRTGSMLMPVGPLNEFHEPPLFYSVERPYVQTYIIPTTWNEGGVGAFGVLPGGFKYRLYGVSGLNAEGFTAATGIRGGRGGVGEEPSEDLAVVGRLEYVGFPGLEAGTSIYWGGANTTKNSALGDADVSLFEGDLRFRKAGFDLRGVLAFIKVNDAGKISVCPNPPCAGEVIGEEMVGWYLEGAYNLLHLLALQSEQAVVAFARYEAFNTQSKVPAGFTADPTNDRQVINGGFAYYPIRDIALKADVERWNDATNAKGLRFNLGVAYQF